ncbi:unnamed protein product [Blepharisma stoltei]|uniref:Uncharacterized protein n=1 Tax=Blepharisma stoltei TaxID=1481888 RepID=A0AAU9KK97_9CILI|nr:unnamed protein product [Blepharisma stoltei]
MKRIPYYLLCEILTSVGPINEAYLLSLVCKEWYRAMKNSLHLGTLKGHKMGTKKFWKCRMKFLSQWRLYELNFQGSCLFPSKSFIEVINVSQPKILNLSSCNVSDFALWVDIICSKKKKYGNENSFYNVEELRITNLKRGYYDKDTYKFMVCSNYKTILELFPNLKRLYAGNTAATAKDVALIISGYKRLEFLDLSNSPYLKDIEKDSEALNCILSSNLKTLFISLEEQNSVVDVIRNKGIRVVTQNLGEILRDVIEEANTSKLEEWLKYGGDVNLYEFKFEVNQEWANPLIRLTELSIDVELLEKIIRIIIKSGANLSHEFFCAVIAKNMIRLVRLLMKSGCNIWYTGYYFRNNSDIMNVYSYNYWLVAITWAAKVTCETQDFSILDILVDDGVHKIDFFDNFAECTPYCIAIENEDIKLFSYLIHKKFAFWKCKGSYKSEHLNPLIFHPKILDYAFTSGNFSLDEFPFDWVYDGLRYYLSNNNLKGASSLLQNLILWGIKEKEKELVVQNKSTNFCCLYKSIVCLAYNHNKGCKKMLEYLLEQGFDLNSVCEHETPLFISAAEYGDVEMMEFFYKNGAQINVQDFRGYTALHSASANGHEKAVMQLIDWGVSTSITNNNGSTALMLAEMNNRIKICELLQIYEEKQKSEHKKKCAII